VYIKLRIKLTYDQILVSVSELMMGGGLQETVSCILLLVCFYLLYMSRVYNIRMDLQEVGCGYVDWIGLAQDRDRWRTLVSAVMNVRVP